MDVRVNDPWQNVASIGLELLRSTERSRRLHQTPVVDKEVALFHGTLVHHYAILDDVVHNRL